MRIELLHQMKELLETKRKLQAEQRRVQDKINEVQPMALQEMADAGIQNMNINGKTIYLQRTVRPKIAEGWTRQEVVQSLKDHGLGDFLKEDFNMNSLGAYLRELTQDSDNVQLPDGLTMSEEYNILLRSGK